jgi:hypothetical protein
MATEIILSMLSVMKPWTKIRYRSYRITKRNEIFAENIARFTMMFRSKERERKLKKVLVIITVDRSDCSGYRDAGMPGG